MRIYPKNPKDYNPGTMVIADVNITNYALSNHTWSYITRDEVLMILEITHVFLDNGHYLKVKMLPQKSPKPLVYFVKSYIFIANFSII